MKATDEQIKTLERMLGDRVAMQKHLADLDGNNRVRIERNEAEFAALTAILADWRESRELLEAAEQIRFQRGRAITNCDGKSWAFNGVGVIPTEHDSVLDAFAEVKKEKGE